MAAKSHRGQAAESARSDFPSIQQLLDEEKVPVPDVLRDERPAFLGSDDLPADRYFSQEFFNLEATRLWPKVWQLACFEQDIPEVGDHIVYEILDWSFILVRCAPDRIKAFDNACLHRGRQLCDNVNVAENSSSFVCPFHAFTWNLDGTFKSMPSSIRWDFPHVKAEQFSLPEVRCETWDGIVFINMDPDAEPLLDFLGDLTRHFERWPFKHRRKSAHVVKVVRANWKVTLEAFIESMHVYPTHSPQVGLGNPGVSAEHDIYGNFDRSIMAPPTPNPHIGAKISEQDLFEDMVTRGMLSRRGAELDTKATLPDGATVRHFMAEQIRASGNTDMITSGAVAPPGTELTDLELTSPIWYHVFPNWFPWASSLFYRFRPYGTDVNTSLMEIFYLTNPKEGEQGNPPAEPLWLGPDDSWSEAESVLGQMWRVFDQDQANMPYVHKGLKNLARSKPSKGVTLANYQEIRVRHFHKMLDRYLGS